VRISGIESVALLERALAAAGVSVEGRLTTYEGPLGNHVDLPGLPVDQVALAQAVLDGLGQTAIFVDTDEVDVDMRITGWSTPARVIVVHPTGEEESEEDLAAPWEAIFTPQVAGLHHIMVIGENGVWSGERWINVRESE
jgi:hypothetical protein